MEEVIITWSFLSFCMTTISILFYAKMHRILFQLILVFIFSPFTFILLQFIFTFIFINEGFRLIVSFYLRIRYGGKVQLIKYGIDAMLHYKVKGNNRMVLAHIILNNGKINRNQVVKQLEEKIFNGRNYDKLKKVVETYCGYVCLRDTNKDFNIEDHVRIIDDKNYNEDELMEFHMELSLDMDNKKPQWEIIIIPNYTNENSNEKKAVVIFRFHHSYMDGMSLLMMVEKLSDDFKYQINPITFRIPIWKLIFLYTKTIVFGTLQILPLFYNLFQKHWIISEEGTYGKRYYVCIRNKIHVDTIRKIRSYVKASVPTILSLAFAESVRMTLPPDRVVNEIRMGEILAKLPYPNTKPQNRYLLFSYAVNMNKKFENMLQKLKSLKSIAKDVMTGPQPFLTHYQCRLIGRFPTFVHSIFLNRAVDSAYLSNVPCSKENFLIFGGECEAFGAFPPCISKTGIIIGSLSVCKTITLCGAADATWLSNTELKEIMEGIPRIIQELADSVPSEQEGKKPLQQRLIDLLPVSSKSKIVNGTTNGIIEESKKSESQESLNEIQGDDIDDINQNATNKKPRKRSKKKKKDTNKIQGR